MNDPSSPASPERVLLCLNLGAGGGAERQIALWLEHGLADRIVMLEPGNDHGVPDDRVDVLSDHGPRTHALWKVLCLPLYAWRLHRLLPAGPLTVVSVLERPNYVNVLLGALRPHRSVLNVQVHVFTHYAHGLKRLNLFLIRRLYPRADRITANSARTLADLATTLGGDPGRYRVVPNFYPGTRLREWAAESLTPDERAAFGLDAAGPGPGAGPGAGSASGEAPASLLSSGRLSAQKGPWHLIRCFALLHRRRPRARLVVLNDGELRNDCARLARRLGLGVHEIGDAPDPDASVRFLGVRSNPYRLFAAATVSLHPSFYEGLPNALIEAMSVGACCIASDCPSGPREILAPDAPLDAIAVAPMECEAGVLMPPFEDAAGVAAAAFLDFDEIPPTPVELAWVEVMDRLLGDGAARRALAMGARRRAAAWDVSGIEAHAEALR